MTRAPVILLLACVGCTEPHSMADPTLTADKLFQAELGQRGLQYAINADGLYEVAIGDIVATVNLENIRRTYERDRDRGAIARFADQLQFFDSIPSWAGIQPFVRYSLEPSDYKGRIADTVHEAVNDDLVKVLVYVPRDGSRISWITNDMVADWQVTREEVVALGNKNMDQIASETVLEIQDVDGAPLGMLITAETPFKASLILSSEFRNLVSASHGWPVYVVVPARDFVYVIPTEHRGFLGRLGPVVLREYKESGYPVTQDVLEVGDDGVTAIGTFAPEDS